MGRPRKDPDTAVVSKLTDIGESGETVREQERRTFTEEEFNAAVAKAVQELMAKQTPSSRGNDGMVTVLYMAEVSKDSTLEIPGYGTMRPMGYLEVPKREFGNKFMSALVRKLIERRHLIVMDGLTPDERRRWDCDYREGEVLSERVFDRMLDIPTDKLAEIFKGLCDEHKRFVARRMITARENGDNRVSIEKAKVIDELSRSVDPEGMLRPVLESLGDEIRGRGR